jgi:hypothetical protein
VGVHVTDPLTDPHFYLTNRYWRETNLPWLIDKGRGCGATHYGCKARMTIPQSRWVHGIAFGLALAAVLGRLVLRDQRALWKWRRPGLDDPATRLLAATLLILAALLINALVCGARSQGPSPAIRPASSGSPPPWPRAASHPWPAKSRGPQL